MYWDWRFLLYGHWRSLLIKISLKKFQFKFFDKMEHKRVSENISSAVLILISKKYFIKIQMLHLPRTSTRVLTAMRASSWTPPVLLLTEDWNICNNARIIESEIIGASAGSTLRRTRCRVLQSSDWRSLYWDLSACDWIRDSICSTWKYFILCKYMKGFFRVISRDNFTNFRM